jgi:replicative DNA helicase
VDYLQLMTAGGNGKEEGTGAGNLTRNLKALAKELNVPVIALSQFACG